MTTAYATVDDYLDAQPVAHRATLLDVRAAIRKALPEAEEVISYGIPAYRVNGRVAIFFAGWKAHYSIYPLSDAVLAALGEELRPYTLAKGTIRFPLSEPVPADLIGRIAQVKAREAGAMPPTGRRR
jgi:uncharacterized protein YdhG (YjbR/CyaY superfamily)